MTGRDDLPPIEWHRELASTQDRLREKAAEGAAFGTAVGADEQTAGRGRRGRAWVSAAGEGLWLSILVAREGGGELHGFPLVVGVRLAMGLERLLGGRIMVKWPNDLYIESGELPGRSATDQPSPIAGYRKVGGILCESVPASPSRRAAGVAVGIGINVSGAPEGAGALVPWAGRDIEIRTLAAAVVDAVVPEPADAPLRLDAESMKEIAERDLLRGQRVLTEAAGEGVAVGIGSDGTLRLLDSGGTERRVWSGSVRPAGRDAHHDTERGER